jgi:hypothetical protein
MSYKLCEACGQPMLKKGQHRKHPDDYRHAQGCPLDRTRIKANQKFKGYMHPDTDAIWFGFSLGMRCAERLEQNIRATEAKPEPEPK